MKSAHLGFLVGLAIPLSLWLIGAGQAKGQDVEPGVTGDPCTCIPSAETEYGTFRDAAVSAQNWWLPKDERVPFEILGAKDERLISAVPFTADDEHAILMRVGARAQRSGDSRTLGYFSEEIRDPGDTESQALYGVNLYSGSATATQLGVHGMAQSRPGARNSIAAIVGTQGFASHLDQEGGLTRNVFGLSGVAQTGASEEVNGTIHNLVGVHGQSQSRSAAHVNQALSVYARAPEISGSGTVGVAAAGRFDQPSGASNENHAIIVTGDPDELSIGFLPGHTDGAAKSIAWREESQSFDFSHGVGLPVYTTADRPAPGVPGKLIFNSDHRNINIDTGQGWIMPNGKKAN